MTTPTPDRAAQPQSRGERSFRCWIWKPGQGTGAVEVQSDNGYNAQKKAARLLKTRMAFVVVKEMLCAN